MNMIKLNKVMDEGSKRRATMLNRFYIVIKTFIKCTSFSIYLKNKEKNFSENIILIKRAQQRILFFCFFFFLHNKLQLKNLSLVVVALQLTKSLHILFSFQNDLCTKLILNLEKAANDNANKKTMFKISSNRVFYIKN